MRKKITALAAAGILLFAACSGDDDDDAATDTTQEDGGGGDSNAADTGGGGGGDGGTFCDEAAQLFQTTSGLDPNEQLSAAEALDPPAEIAEDWDRLIEGSRQASESSAGLDPNDPEASEEFQQQYEDLMDATTNVYTYLGEECGLEGFTPPSDNGQVTVPTTAAG